MSKSIYERVLNLRDRISLDVHDTVYEEDCLLLDEVLELIENIGGEDTDIETQIYDYNNTIDIYNELEVGVKFKKQASVIMRVIDDVVRKNYGDENNLWLTEDEAEEQDDYPGMLSGIRGEVLEVITKILKEEE